MFVAQATIQIADWLRLLVETFCHMYFRIVFPNPVDDMFGIDRDTFNGSALSQNSAARISHALSASKSCATAIEHGAQDISEMARSWDASRGTRIETQISVRRGQEWKTEQPYETTLRVRDQKMI